MEDQYGDTSHFELLGLEPRFSINTAEIDEGYRALQRKLHPDRHAQAEEHHRDLVEAHSARVNEAANTLRSPLKRAGYWMQLHGVRVLEEDQRIDDMETMMEVMEISEEISDAESQADINKILGSVGAKIAEVEQKLDQLFQKQDWDAARGLVERLQMLTRLQERANAWSL